MAGFCRVSILGNLGSDPETRYTPNGAMNLNFSMAVNPVRRRNDTAEAPPTWYRVTAWGQLAERLDKLVQAGHIAKGRQLYIEGKLEPRQFTGNDGTTRWSFDVTASEFEFTGTGRDQQGQGEGGGGYSQPNRPRDDGDSGNQNSGGYDDPGPSNIDDVPF